MLDLSEDAIDNINPINKTHNNFLGALISFKVDQLSWYEFAATIYNQLDEMNKIEKTEVLPIKTIEYLKSARPLNTALDCSKTEMNLSALPMWENELNVSLKEY